MEIPSDTKIFYPSFIDDNSIKNNKDFQKLFMIEKEEYQLISFGINDENYFSAYFQPIQRNKRINKSQDLLLDPLKEYSNIICEDLKSKYSSKTQEIAFKQKLKSVKKNKKNIDYYDIQLVNYPSDKPIIKRQVYIKHNINNNIHR